MTYHFYFKNSEPVYEIMQSLKQFAVQPVYETEYMQSLKQFAVQPVYETEYMQSLKQFAVQEAEQQIILGAFGYLTP